MDTYFDGWWVIFKNLHDSHHAEGQISRGSEEQWGCEATDGNQHFHLAENGHAWVVGVASTYLPGSLRGWTTTGLQTNCSFTQCYA